MIFIDNIEFLCTFDRCYERNNKSSGQKSLRCFPECRENGHVDRGFCGKPLVAQFHVSPAVGAVLASHPLYIIGEIHSVNTAGLSSCQNTMIKREIINENLRSNNNVTKNPIFGGDVEFIKPVMVDGRHAKTMIRVRINKSMESWNYGWHSNRWNTEMHLIEILLCGNYSDYRTFFEKRIHTITPGELPNERSFMSNLVSPGESYQESLGTTFLDSRFTGNSDAPAEDTENLVILGTIISPMFSIICTKDAQVVTNKKNSPVVLERELANTQNVPSNIRTPEMCSPSQNIYRSPSTKSQRSVVKQIHALSSNKKRKLLSAESSEMTRLCNEMSRNAGLYRSEGLVSRTVSAPESMNTRASERLRSKTAIHYNSLLKGKTVSLNCVKPKSNTSTDSNESSTSNMKVLCEVVDDVIGEIAHIDKPASETAENGPKLKNDKMESLQDTENVEQVSFQPGTGKNFLLHESAYEYNRNRARIRSVNFKGSSV